MRIVSSQKRELSELRYSILLIITDGIGVDVAQTRQKLSIYADLPLSVIIVGVGRADFTIMQELAELGTERKNVTFLEFRKYQEDDSSGLALGCIPQQMVEYMMANRISPIAD